MAKFHINPSTGEAGACSAVKGKCPFGGPADHYGSADEARAAYEVTMSSHAVVPQKRAKTLGDDIFVSVFTSTKDVLTENFPRTLGEDLEPGIYSASYYDQASDSDHYIKITVTDSGAVEYERTKGFKPVSSPASSRAKRAISNITAGVENIETRNDPFYCRQNRIDRVTLIEHTKQVRRLMAKYDWSTAEGVFQGRQEFEELEDMLDNDLVIAQERGLVEESNALTESKRIVSSFITELTSRRS